MTTYSLNKELEGYVHEMNDGIADKKGSELIMKLKMNEEIMIEDMYKVQSFDNLEALYIRLGDDLFTPKHSEGLKALFKMMFNY